MSFELFYFDSDGKRRDEKLHAELLSSEEGRLAFEISVLRRVLERGLSLEEALQMYVSPDLWERLVSLLEGKRL